MFPKFFTEGQRNHTAIEDLQKYTLNSNTHSQLSQGQQFNEGLGRWAQGRKNKT